MQMKKTYQQLPQSSFIPNTNNSRPFKLLIAFLFISGIALALSFILTAPVKSLRLIRFSQEWMIFPPDPHACTTSACSGFLDYPPEIQETPSDSNLTPTEEEEEEEVYDPEKRRREEEEDKKLLKQASRTPKVAMHPQKVAFMFLVRGEIPLTPIWERFFKGYQELYSIYVHTDPLYNGTAPEGSVFHGKRIPSRVSS